METYAIPPVFGLQFLSPGQQNKAHIIEMVIIRSQTRHFLIFQRSRYHDQPSVIGIVSRYLLYNFTSLIRPVSGEISC